MSFYLRFYAYRRESISDLTRDLGYAMSLSDRVSRARRARSPCVVGVVPRAVHAVAARVGTHALLRSLSLGGTPGCDRGGRSRRRNIQNKS